MHAIHHVETLEEEQEIKLNKSELTNWSQHMFEIIVVYEWVQNKLIYANLQSSSENKPNLMMTYDNFFVCVSTG